MIETLQNTMKVCVITEDESVKIVILQVSKDIMFSKDLQKAATTLNGFYARIEDLSDISPTILELTSAYTSLVDDDDLQVRTSRVIHWKIKSINFEQYYEFTKMLHKLYHKFS